MVEMNDGGNMYSKIQRLIEGKTKLDLKEWVPLKFIELVYDVTIQLSTAIDFAH